MKIEEAQVALLCRERIFAVAARCSSLTFDRCCFSLLSPCPFGILLLLVRPCWVPPSALRWAPPFVRSLSRETFLLIQADNPQVRLHCGGRGEKRLRERCCPLSPLLPPHRRNLGGGGRRLLGSSRGPSSGRENLGSRGRQLNRSTWGEEAPSFSPFAGGGSRLILSHNELHNDDE